MVICSIIFSGFLYLFAGMPPEQYEDAIDTVISQCEMWTDNYEQ